MSGSPPKAAVERTSVDGSNAAQIDHADPHETGQNLRQNLKGLASDLDDLGGKPGDIAARSRDARYKPIA
jgi:hypothetical protein